MLIRKRVATAWAIDGNPNSYWLTADRGREQAHPHELSISFPRPVAMTGFVCMNRQNDREHKGDICDYVIETSDDGQVWKELLKGKLEPTTKRQMTTGEIHDCRRRLNCCVKRIETIRHRRC